MLGWNGPWKPESWYGHLMAIKFLFPQKWNVPRWLACTISIDNITEYIVRNEVSVDRTPQNSSLSGKQKLEDHLLPGHPILFRPLKTSASCGWAAAHNPPWGSRSGITSVIIIGHDNHGQNLGVYMGYPCIILHPIDSNCNAQYHAISARKKYRMRAFDAGGMFPEGEPSPWTASIYA